MKRTYQFSEKNSFNFSLINEKNESRDYVIMGVEEGA